MYEKVIELQRSSLVCNGAEYPMNAIFLFLLVFFYYYYFLYTTSGQLTLSFLHTLRLLSVHPALCRESIQSTSFLHPLQHCFSESFLTQPDAFEFSPKMGAVEVIVQEILETTDELILVISTYTQILDFFCQFCDRKSWGYFRLDGTTDVSQRQSLVNSFNSRFTNKRLFVLSARAGGVGLNITGASRVVMLEPAWNPAIDAQSIARSWRFGQTRTVYVYRLFLSGSIEEVMLQRQLLKKDIADVAVDHTSVGEGKLDKDELREVFRLKDVPCHTYELMKTKEKTTREVILRSRSIRTRKRRVVEEKESEGECEVIFSDDEGFEKKSVLPSQQPDQKESSEHSTSIHLPRSQEAMEDERKTEEKEKEKEINSVKEEDPVWKAYHDHTSITEDSLLRNIVQKCRMV